MKPKTIQIYCALALVEAGVTLFYLFNMTFPPGRGQIIDYSTLRVLVALVVSLSIFAFGTALVFLTRRGDTALKITTRLDGFLVGENGRLFTVQGGLLIAALFLTECYLPHLPGFPAAPAAHSSPGARFFACRPGSFCA